MICVNYYIDALPGFYLFLIGILAGLFVMLLLWIVCAKFSSGKFNKVSDIKQTTKSNLKIDQRNLLINNNYFETNNSKSDNYSFIFYNNFDKWKNINRSYINVINHVNPSNLYSVNESIIHENIVCYNDLEFHQRNERITGQKYLYNQLLNLLLQQKLIATEEYQMYNESYERKYKAAINEFNYQCDAHLNEIRSKAPLNTTEAEMQILIADKFPQKSDLLINKIINELNIEVRETLLKVQAKNKLSNDDVNSIYSMYLSNKGRLDEFLSGNQISMKEGLERRLDNLKRKINEEVINDNVQEIGYQEHEQIFLENMQNTLSDMSDTEKKRILDDYRKNINAINDQYRADLNRQKEALAKKMENGRKQEIENVLLSYEKEFEKYINLTENISLDKNKVSLDIYQKLMTNFNEEVLIRMEAWDEKEISETKKLKDSCSQSIEADLKPMEFQMLQNLYQGRGINNYDLTDILGEHQQNIQNMKRNLQQERKRQMKRMNDMMNEKQKRNMIELNNGIEIQLEEGEKQQQIVRVAMDNQMELPSEMKNRILQDSRSNEINIQNQLLSLKVRQQKQLELALAKKMSANKATAKPTAGPNILPNIDEFEEEVNKVELDKEAIILEMRDKLAIETKAVLGQYEDEICNIMAMYQVSHARNIRKKKNHQTLIDNLCKEISHPAFQQNPLATQQVMDQLENDKANLENMKKNNQEEQKRKMELRLKEKKAKIENQNGGVIQRRYTDQLLAYKRGGVNAAALKIAGENLEDKMKEEMEKEVKMEQEEETKYFEKSKEKYEEDIEKSLLDKTKEVLSRLVLINEMTSSQISDLIDKSDPNIDEETKKSIINDIKRKTNNNMKEKELYQFLKSNNSMRKSSGEDFREGIVDNEEGSNKIQKKKKKRMKKREQDIESEDIYNDI